MLEKDGIRRSTHLGFSPLHTHQQANRHDYERKNTYQAQTLP
jgi:hypothetical protein